MSPLLHVGSGSIAILHVGSGSIATDPFRVSAEQCPLRSESDHHHRYIFRAVSQIRKWLPDVGLATVRLHAGSHYSLERSARTTNAIERLHEEFKRRIKTQDEARRIAANIAKLPELLQRKT